ncbi:MAG: restriction endonuclease subunit S [Leptolyngbyaceae cyanobacterium SM1_4_3]|nr:restriction endonuclease subunit S [Leptolyngbyaceae cyanobacterium SM1_4_3]
MKTTRLDLPVMASWMESNQRRLDGSPYLSGAFEAKVILERLPKEKRQHLREVTQGGLKGIFNGPRFARSYVDDPDYGVPFLGSTDILAADLSNLAMISKKQVKARPELLIDEGWTLITCSGTIGRMVYSRADMKGMAGSQHFMRVVPDRTKIPPGYLYAYLSSKFGVPLVVSGTYGAIIQHIEPHHIADLPVPRLGDAIEAEVHELVEEAAKLRTQASALLYSAIQKLEDTAGLPHLPRNYIHSEPDTSVASSRLLVSRLDGLFHSSYHKSALDPLTKLPESLRTTVGEMAKSIVEPTRFKRVQVDNAEHGIPFFGTASIMWVEPEPAYYIPKKMAGINEYVVTGKTVLIPRSGQLSGIIGHPVLPYGPMIGGAVSEHGIRVMADSEIIAGYLFIALVSEYGRRQLKPRAFGSSIPTLDVNMICQVIIPKLPDQYIEEIGDAGWQTSQLRSKAIEKEHQARKTVETAIEKGAASNL